MSNDQGRPPHEIEFHLMRGGLFYRLMVKLRLQGVEHGFVFRRSLVLVGITWVPLLLLSLAQGLALPGAVKVPFLYDFSIHVTFLVTLPLLVIAENVIDPAISIGMSQFLERGLIKDKDRPAFDSILAWADRRCDSAWSELVIAFIAVIPFMFARSVHWADRLADSWFLTPSGDALSLAGFWAIFVSGFFMRAFLFRWVWRLLIWTRMLHRLARLDLNTVATHPDRAGGLGFMGQVEMRFGILSFAVGALTSANLAANILFQNSTLASERIVVLAFIVSATIVLLLPLLALAGAIKRTWLKGLHEYGALSSGYVQQFHRKWVQRENPAAPAAADLRPEGEALLGTGDIQSLADLGNSYNMVREMNFLPIGRREITFLILSAALPMLPLIFLDPAAMEVAKKLLQSLS